MTVPAGARIIANKFETRCKCGCKTLVPTGVGAAILDPNINGGKWATFQPEHLPSPYERDDIHAAQGNGSGWHGHRKYRGPVTPEHQRCASASCAHWRLDHVGSAPAVQCIGSFNGAQCNCTQFIEPSVVVGSTPPRTLTFVPKSQAEIDAEIKARNDFEMAQIIKSAEALATTMTIAPTIVCFYGPIKSASDGQQHFVYPQDIAHLHGIDADIMAATRVQFVSPEQKRTWRPPTLGDVFIIGPHFTPDEYEQAKNSLHNWLEEKGII